MLLAAWLAVGMAPFLLQARSFLKFVTPHKISEALVAPPDTVRETANLTDLCPATGFLMAEVWWNVVPTHYSTVKHGRICHVVVPQYNLHGGYRVGDVKVAPFHSTPLSCKEDSYFFENYLYHGSLGYYSFYEEAHGSYCALDNTAYALVDGLGTFDINGWFLANDAGSDEYRRSYWYGTVGMFWVVYRAFVLRRSYILCKRYGKKCAEMGETLHRKVAMVFAHESMRLSAHGASNSQRFVLLYLLIEGLMSDLFLLIAYDGIFAKIQYISLGYNLSGLLLLLWEILENMDWLLEKWRMLIKRLLYSYESSWMGELLSAAVQQHFLVSLNRSNLKNSQPTAVAISYYAWSLIWHTTYVLMLVGFILSVRAVWAIVYVMVKTRTLAVFSKPCCVDTVLGSRCRMTMLDSYCLLQGQLYYKVHSLLAFGILQTKEAGGAEFLAVNKLHWYEVPTDNLVVIGSVTGSLTQSCTERTCTNATSFFDQNLGGTSTQSHRTLLIRRDNQISTGPSSLNVLISP
ncbi:hypothetical protein V7S43_002053 [Phytophthora oleae]|uniref:Uncharacterized protein n=1 Tax=Phytophthora oleae TaxID=2107226 RepID=A0ABD3G487_9STRA